VGPFRQVPPPARITLGDHHFQRARSAICFPISVCRVHPRRLAGLAESPWTGQANRSVVRGGKR